MNIREIQKLAIEYLYNTHGHGHHQIEYWGLNRQLNYILCNACERLNQQFGEVTRKDIIMLVETWLIKIHDQHVRKHPWEDTQSPLSLDQPRLDREAWEKKQQEQQAP